MADRPRECTKRCPMYRLSEDGCVYREKIKGEENSVEKIEPGERCRHPEFDATKYIRLWASGIAGNLD